MQTSFDKLLTKLTFINEQLIPENIWRISEALVADIDIDDTDFVGSSVLPGFRCTGPRCFPGYGTLLVMRQNFSLYSEHAPDISSRAINTQ